MTVFIQLLVFRDTSVYLSKIFWENTNLLGEM